MHCRKRGAGGEFSHSQSRHRQEILITDREFTRIFQFIEQDTGIRLPEANHHLVKRFVEERLAFFGMDVQAYALYVKEDNAEYDLFLDAVTINETYFFREEKQFKVIDTMIFPKYFNARQERLTFWSAACSTGEEAISLAALAEKFWGTRPASAYAVFASDLSGHALQTFQGGKFKANSFRQDGSSFRPLLEPFIDRQGKFWCVKDELKRNIRIQQLNLFRDNFSQIPSRFHLVFLRNMLIYMPLNTRRKILDNIIGRMADDGYLFLSSTETPQVSHPELKLIDVEGVYFFQKKTLQDKQQGCFFDRQLVEEISEQHFVEQPVVEVSPKDVRKKHIPDVKRMCLFANQKLNNRLFSVKNNTNYSLALECLQIVLFINSNKFVEAGKSLETMNRDAAPNEISLYLAGYLDMVEQRNENAVRQYFKALQYNASFWPARFYLGMLLRKTSPRRAYRQFATCRKNIVDYLETNSYDYRFLLEGFNAKYFLDMCRKWEKKLDD